jgi:hypothetical protein
VAPRGTAASSRPLSRSMSSAGVSGRFSSISVSASGQVMRAA